MSKAIAKDLVELTPNPCGWERLLVLVLFVVAALSPVAGCYSGLSGPNALWPGAAMLTNQLIKRVQDRQALLSKMD